MLKSHLPTQILTKGSTSTVQFNRKRWLLRLAGTAILLILLWRLHLDLNQIALELWRVNIWPVAIAVGLIFPIAWLKALRWRVILGDLGVTVRQVLAWRLYGLGLSAGSLTPGQAGDMVKAWYLQEAPGYSLTSALLSVIIDRLYDLVVLMGLALVGLLWLGGDFTGQIPLLALGVVSLAVLTACLIVPAFRVKLISPVLNLLVRRKLRRVEAATPTETTANITATDLNPTGILLALLTTMLTATLAIVRTWLLALSLGINFGAAEALAASSLATVSSLVPVTISGIGMRDIVLVTIMAQIGQSQEAAVSLSTLLLLLNLFNLVAGYLIYKVKLPAR